MEFKSASELREITQQHIDEADIKQLHKILSFAEDMAAHGRNRIVISTRDISTSTIKKLQQLGYSITLLNSKTYRLSW